MCKKDGKRYVGMLWLWVLLVLVFFLSFLLGRYPVPPSTVTRILAARAVEALCGGRFTIGGFTAAERAVVLNIRLPRIVAAALIGAALATAGASFQAVFHNPMVSPDILGASTGAGFGAALAILLGGSYLAITLSSFLFGLTAVALALLVSSKSPLDRLLSLILSGMMVGSLFSGGTSFVKLVADTSNQLPAITYWLMGSLSSFKGKDLMFLLVPVLAGLVPVLLLRWRFNILTLSDDEAKSMGTDVGAIRIAAIAAATLMTSASVALSGMIGWVGLVVPHFARLTYGDDYALVLPASALMGSSFLILVDTLSRILVTSEIPIGILTSFIGAPLFISLILRGRRR